MGKLSETVQELIKKGYSTENIKNYLAEYGYGARDTEQAIEEASFSLSTQQVKHVKHTHHVATSGMLLMLMLLIVLAGAATLVLKFTGVLGGSEALLDLEIQPEKLTIYPDNELRFSLRIVNLGSKDKFDAFVKYKVTDDSGKTVLSQEETFAVSTSVTRDKALPGPEEPGKYLLSLVADYDGKKAISSFTFSVKEKIEKNPDQQDQEKAKEAMETVEELTASKQYNRAEIRCMALEHTDDIDNCLSFVVRESRNSQFCQNINNDEARDNCFMSFIVEGQSYLCDKVVLESSQQYCDRVADVQLLAKYYQAS